MKLLRKSLILLVKSIIFKIYSISPTFTQVVNRFTRNKISRIKEQVNAYSFTNYQPILGWWTKSYSGVKCVAFGEKWALSHFFCVSTVGHRAAAKRIALRECPVRRRRLHSSVKVDSRVVERSGYHDYFSGEVMSSQPSEVLVGFAGVMSSICSIPVLESKWR